MGGKLCSESVILGMAYTYRTFRRAGFFEHVLQRQHGDPPSQGGWGVHMRTGENQLDLFVEWLKNFFIYTHMYVCVYVYVLPPSL